MGKLTSFGTDLWPRFVKQLRKYPLVCIKGLKFRDMAFSRNFDSKETLMVKYIS